MTPTKTPSQPTQSPPAAFPRRIFKFTPTRRVIIELLVKYANLTTNDFYRLLPPNSEAKIDSHKRSTRETIRDFAKWGYLVRRKWFDDENLDTRFNTPVSVYALSKAGLRLAREKALANGHGKHAGASSERNESVGHEYEITRFHLAVDTLPKTVVWRQEDLRHGVNPDALFAVRENDGSGFFYFLEIEKSKQGHYVDGESGLMKKLGRYYAYQRSDECKRDWDYFNEFRVIIVVKNEDRRQNLLEAASNKFKSRMFWVTTQDLYRKDIGGAIFKTPKDYQSTAHSLLDN